MSHKTGQRAKVCLQKAEQKKQSCRDQERNTNQPTSDDHPLAEHSLYNFYNAETKPMIVEWSIGQNNTTMEVNTHGNILLAQHKYRGCNYKPHTFTSYYTYTSRWRITEYFNHKSCTSHRTECARFSHSPYTLAMPFVTHKATDISKSTFLEIYLYIPYTI